MPLVVAPLEGFDSYVSREQADSYFAALGKSDWVSLEGELKDACLRRGSQYIGARRLLSEFVTPAVHPNVRAATCEAAYRVWQGLIYNDTAPVAPAVKAVTVGPIKQEFADVAPSTGERRFPIIDDLLYGMTSARGMYGSITLERG